MGDRANVFVKEQYTEELKGVWLYTHWGGSDLAQTVQNALKRKWRWSDSAYLARIIFDAMTQNQHGEETGFGISTQMCDNEYKIICIDCDSQIIGFACKPKKGQPPRPFVTWPMEEFIKLSPTELNAHYLED